MLSRDKFSFEAVMIIAKQCCIVLYIGRVPNVNCSSGDIPSNIGRGLGDRSDHTFRGSSASTSVQQRWAVRCSFRKYFCQILCPSMVLRKNERRRSKSADHLKRRRQVDPSRGFDNSITRGLCYNLGFQQSRRIHSCVRHDGPLMSSPFHDRPSILLPIVLSKLASQSIAMHFPALLLIFLLFCFSGEYLLRFVWACSCMHATAAAPSCPHGRQPERST